MNNFFKTSHKLAQWQQANLLTPQQVKAIETFEAHQQHQWSGWWFMALGIFAIFLGCMGYVASNWENLTDAYKLSGLGLGLAGLTAALLHQVTKRPQTLLTEGLLLGWLAYTLVALCLTAEIYAITQPLWRIMLLWSVISLPVVCLASRNLAAIIWFAVTLAALFQSLEVIQNITTRIAIGLALPPLLLIFSLAMRELNSIKPFAHATRLFAFAGLILLWLPFIQIPLKLSFDAPQGISSAQQIWQTALSYHNLQILIFALLLCATWISSKLVSSQKILLSLAILALLGQQLLVSMNIVAANSSTQWLEHGLALVSVFAVAAYAATQFDHKLYNTALLLAAGRLLYIYIEWLDNIAYTSLALISIGLIILGLVWLWRTYRLPLQVKLQQWLQVPPPGVGLR